ncbi:MAG: hypothetical protein CM1200mP22_29830 [Dehalococcoidia bacterium]|nr:MAG: hypothetical protein CM1200mP22_29830 [Dehalococcoidia bacterium]
MEQMKDLEPADAEIFITALHGPARKLLTMSVPAIAAIKGPCLGGALELILACDIRIATEGAIMGLPEVQVGIPSVIEASLLPPTVGLGRARRLLLTGETVNAAEALAMGLVDIVVPEDSLMNKAHEIADQFLGMSRDVLASQKDIITKWLELGEEILQNSLFKNFPGYLTLPHLMKACHPFFGKAEAQLRHLGSLYQLIGEYPPAVPLQRESISDARLISRWKIQSLGLLLNRHR